MGAEFLIGGAILSSLAGGISGKREADKQADAAAARGREQERLRAKEVKSQIARNTALFAKSGVSLEGSPLFALEQDAKTGVEDINAISANTRAEVSSLKGQGRSALLGGIAGALGTAAVAPSGTFSKKGK